MKFKNFLKKRVVKLLFLIIFGLIAALFFPLLPKANSQQASGERENLYTVNQVYTNAQIENIQPSVQDLLNQGTEAYQNGQFAKAEESWQKAIQLISGDIPNLALAWNYLSLAYQQLGRWDEAKKAIATSLELLNKNIAISNSPEKLPILARVLTTQGRFQLAQGEPENALETLKQAEAVYQKIDDKEGIIGSQINQAQAMQVSGRYRQALQILTRLRKTLDTQPDTLLKATSLLSLGNALEIVGDLEHSWCVLQDSLQQAKRLSSVQLIDKIYFSLGNTAQALGKKSKYFQNDIEEPGQQTLSISEDCNNNVVKSNSSGFYQQAQKFYSLAVATPSVSSITRLQAQVNHLNLLVENQDWSEVQKLWPTIYEQMANFSSSRIEIYARISFARSLASIKQKSAISLSWKQIDELLVIAIQHAIDLKDKRSQAYALGNLGWLYEQRQKEKWVEAQEITTQALNLAQAIKAPDIAYQWLWQLGRLYFGKDNIKAIANYTEAVNTLNVFRKGLVAVNLGLTGINSDIQFFFREQVEPVYRELVDLLLTSEGTEPSQEHLQQAREAIESLQVVELENFLRCTLQNEQTVSLDQVANQYNTAIIYPIILPERLAVIVKLPDQKNLVYYQHSVPDYEVGKKLETLRIKYEEKSFTTNDQQRAEEVYNWLIKPLEKSLDDLKVKTLVFVLENRFRNIPIAALYDGKQYLVEKYATALNLGLQLQDPQPFHQKPLVTLLAGITKKVRHLDILEYVGRELEEIAQLLPSKKMRDEQFLSESLQNQIKYRSFSVVHLATHGQFSSQPEKTSVEAWDKSINVNELSDIFISQSKLRRDPIELLVLSACQTAKGDERSVLGLAGVAVQSGARSTIASLWYLNDESSALLMKLFYSYLKSPNVSNKAEALRLAQQDMLRNPHYQKYASPRYWAPYILVGNWL